MSLVSRRIERERKTVLAMVRMFCRFHHDDEDLCPECAELVEYAEEKLQKCPYASAKPACANCPIHCYRPEPRERMRRVMRFAGPRMLKKHPYLAVMHLIDKRRPVPPTPKRQNPPDSRNGG